jgi:hypothetical protein
MTRCLHDWPPEPLRLPFGTVIWICRICGEDRTLEHGPVPGTIEEASERFGNAVRNLGETIAAEVRGMSWRRRIVTAVILLVVVEAVGLVLVRLGWAT